MEQLREGFAWLGLKPQVYLTSTYLRARETGELLAGESDTAQLVAPVIDLAALTPIRPPGNIEEITAQAAGRA